jgi:CheY-like chemotaxis protein
MCAHILVIDDDPTSLELSVHVLEAAGHTIVTARDGEDGLRAARSERPHLILSDLLMSDTDGLAVARQAKEDPELRSIPIVAVTAQAMVGDREAVLAAGFDGYITKPIDIGTLAAELEPFLAKIAVD